MGIDKGYHFVPWVYTEDNILFHRYIQRISFYSMGINKGHHFVPWVYTKNSILFHGCIQITVFHSRGINETFSHYLRIN